MRDDDDRPVTRRRSRQSGTPLAMLLLIGGSVAFFLLGTLVVGGYLLFRGSGKNDVVQSARVDSRTPAIADALGGKVAPVGWVSFQHPEGLYSAKVPMTPVHFGPPEEGSGFAPPRSGFSNSSLHQVTAREFSMTMEVRVFSGIGMEVDQKSDKKLGAGGFGFNTTRKTVI